MMIEYTIPEIQFINYRHFNLCYIRKIYSILFNF